MGEQMKRPIRLSLIQGGGLCEDKKENLKKVLESIEKVAQENRPDFILLNELSMTPYFVFAPKKEEYYEWAEPIPGPSTDAVGEKAKKYGCTIIFPIFQRKEEEKEGYYNSAAVIGPDGKIISGTLPDGRKANHYAKVHLAKTVYPRFLGDENVFFKPGFGFPVFETPKAKIGLLICYDRRFPEAWRTLALKGAEIIFIPLAAVAYKVGKEKAVTIEEQFESELRQRALDNLVYAVACNKGGPETVGGKESLYFGRSCVIDPTGVAVDRAPANEPGILNVTIDMEELTEARKTFLYYDARKPQFYLPVTQG